MLSKTSRKYRNMGFILTILHVVCLLLPLCIFLPQGMTAQDVSTGSKVALSMTAITCLILLLISLMCSAVHRLSIHKSVIWAMLLIMTLVLPTVKDFIIVMAICSLADEIVIMPLRNHCKNKLSINREIDKRS